jgi:threonylcarbamoyladenosine tRNA methylthiotransferase CDKAL1
MLPGKQRIYVTTQGCAHNSSDSEFMMGLLRDYGYGFASSLEDADAILINSCTVKGPSQNTATNLVKRAQQVGKPVVLSGCVPTADSTLAKSLDGVSMLSVTQIDRVVEVVEEALKGNEMRLLSARRGLPSLELPKVRKNRFVEVIPISGGCLGNCSYCKTKHARGKLMSYPPEALLGRALRAVEEGVSEVWLTSEDTGAYGLDIGTNIAALLERIADALLPANVMLKLGMTNPPYMLEHIKAVAAVMNRPNVFAFIHIPVQSGSDAVLQAMIREYTSADFKRLVDGLRERVPDLLVATDVICGFPAESEEAHKETMDLVRHYKFPVLNISQFYPRPGTAAARMRKLPGTDVKRRSGEMTALFNSYETFQRLVGRVERVWFCESDAKHGQTVGHTKCYAKVVVPRDDALLGRSAQVRLESATKWHVQGVIVQASS